MRPSLPGGDLAKVIEAAVTEKLERLEARRYARTKAPRKALADTDTSPRSRRIPAAIRRAVYERDGGRCTFVDAQGRRCTERHRLEYHHAGKAWARGGDHSVGNVQLVCPTHHRLLADLEYGRDWMDRCRRSQRSIGGLPAGVGVARVAGTKTPPAPCPNRPGLPRDPEDRTGPPFAAGRADAGIVSRAPARPPVSRGTDSGPLS